MSNLSVKIPFGLRDNKPIHISDVEESGLACGCVCPACNEPLEARRFTKDPSEYKYSHTDYFAHSKNTNCEYGAESALHYFAKQVLEEEKRIKLPVITYNFPFFYNEEIIPEIDLHIDSVVLEKKIENIKPDIIVEAKGHKLMIEIAVTHFIDQEKKAKIEEIGISTVEIDLSRYNIYDITKEDLKNIIINNTDVKRWTYNAKFKQLVEKKREELQDEIDKKEKEQNQRFERGKELEDIYDNYKLPIEKRQSKGAWGNKKDLWHAIGCPLKKREYSGRYYANIYSDCYNCWINGKKAFKGYRDYKTTVVCLAEYYLRK